MGRFKSKGNKTIIYPTKLYPGILIQLFTKNLFGEADDHTLVGSKLSKQEVMSTRTLIFKM